MQTKRNKAKYIIYGGKAFLCCPCALAGFTLTDQLCIPQGKDFYPVFVTVLLAFSPEGKGK